MAYALFVVVMFNNGRIVEVNNLVCVFKAIKIENAIFLKSDVPRKVNRIINQEVPTVYLVPTKNPFLRQFGF